jgi:long-subunit fatty acid transport protein
MKRWIETIMGMILGICISTAGFAGGFEKPTNLGARATGMGGVAAANNKNVSAAFYNPALFSYVDEWTVGADFLPTLTRSNANFGATLGQVDSDVSVVPIFNVAGAARIADQWVVGLALNTPAGLRSQTTLTPTAIAEVDFKVFEIAPFVTYEVLPGVSVSAQYRASYAMFNQTKPGQAVIKDMTGTSFAAGRFGIAHDVNSNWQYGLAVRTPATVTLSGLVDLPTAGITNAPVDLLDVIYPWSILGGVAYVSDNQNYTIALDTQYILYGQMDTLNFSQDALDTTVNWKNSLKVMIGTEYKIAQNWFTRLGGGVHTPVTNEDFDSQLLTPPGLGFNVGTGIGYQLNAWTFDMSYDVNIGSGFGALASNAPKTSHTAASHAIGLSINYNAI